MKRQAILVVALTVLVGGLLYSGTAQGVTCTANTVEIRDFKINQGATQEQDNNQVIGGDSINANIYVCMPTPGTTPYVEVEFDTPDGNPPVIAQWYDSTNMAPRIQAGTEFKPVEFYQTIPAVNGCYVMKARLHQGQPQRPEDPNTLISPLVEDSWRVYVGSTPCP
jgi:hypothetical protein